MPGPCPQGPAIFLIQRVGASTFHTPRKLARIAICPLAHFGNCEMQGRFRAECPFLRFFVNCATVSAMARFSLYIPVQAFPTPFPQ